MPLYVYRCPEGHEIELLQSFSGVAPDACECGASPLARLLFPVAAHFRGSGFYSTDYGKGNGQKKDAGKSEGKGEGKSEGSAAGKGEGKSDGSATGESKSNSAAA